MIDLADEVREVAWRSGRPEPSPMADGSDTSVATSSAANTATLFPSRLHLRNRKVLGADRSMPHRLCPRFRILHQKLEVANDEIIHYFAFFLKFRIVFVFLHQVRLKKKNVFRPKEWWPLVPCEFVKAVAQMRGFLHSRFYSCECKGWVAKCIIAMPAVLKLICCRACRLRAPCL